jgi:hypothetical protein
MLKAYYRPLWEGSSSSSSTGSCWSPAKRPGGGRLRRRSLAKPAAWSGLGQVEPQNTSFVRLRLTPGWGPPEKHAVGAGRSTRLGCRRLVARRCREPVARRCRRSGRGGGSGGAGAQRRTGRGGGVAAGGSSEERSGGCEMRFGEWKKVNG